MKLKHRPAGMGCLPTLFLVLLVMKLTGYFAYSWWWVFSPLLLQLGFFAVFIFVLVVLIPRAMGRNMTKHNDK